MPGTDIRIDSAEGGAFDTYLSGGGGGGPMTGVILTCSIMGVGPTLRKSSDDLAAGGFLVAAPDLFWRTDPGPLNGADEKERARADKRSKPRREVIDRGIADIADTIAHLKALPQCNGKIGIIGFCFGGAYALLGPSRLGCDAGIAFHGTNLEYWFDDLAAISVPMSIHWGDQDFAAPPEVIEQFRGAAAAMDNVDMHIYPGVEHGYSSPGGEAHDAAATEHSWERARAILRDL